MNDLKYEIGNINISPKLADNNIWLNKEMLSELFNVSIPKINKFIKQIYASKELNQYYTSRTFIDKTKNNTLRTSLYYNLDIVYALELKINSKNAIAFRKWIINNFPNKDSLKIKPYKKRTSSIHYVAYLDMLGTKNIVNNDSNDNYLNDLNAIYQSAINLVNRTFKDEGKNNFSIRIFSDNILISTPLDKFSLNKSKLEHLINLVGYIQVNALKHGYLLRGGITKGAFYKNEAFVHGKALVDAVVLEEENAIYPRIIINRKELCETKPQFLHKDIDDFYYINYYHFSYIDNFDNFKYILLDLLKKYKKVDKVKQKIMWAITYHNEYFSDNTNSNMPQNKPIITQEEIKKIVQEEGKK